MVEDSKSGALRLVRSFVVIACALHASAASAQTPPSTAPAAQPAPAPAAEQSALCVPACRNGFVCVSGGCVSACNPPCPEGSTCTAEGTCQSLAPTYYTPPPAAPAAAAPPPAAPGYYAPPPSARDTEARNERLEAREKPRLTLHLLLDISDFDTSYSRSNESGTLSEEVDGTISTLGVGAAGGFRHNFTQLFGMSARIGVGYGGVLGYTSFDDGDDTDTLGSATTLYADLGVHFSPAWRFYVGPVAWLSNTGFSPSTENTEIGPVETTFHESSLFRAGAGVDIGMWLLPREQLDLNLRLKLDYEGNVHVQFAVGWAFVLGG